MRFRQLFSKLGITKNPANPPTDHSKNLYEEAIEAFRNFDPEKTRFILPETNSYHKTYKAIQQELLIIRDNLRVASNSIEDDQERASVLNASSILDAMIDDVETLYRGYVAARGEVDELTKDVEQLHEDLADSAEKLESLWSNGGKIEE